MNTYALKKTVLTSAIIVFAVMAINEARSQEPPEVVDHDIPKTLADVTAICKKSLETNTGCATVTIDTRVCFAYLDENGYGATVHCFPNGAEL